MKSSLKICVIGSVNLDLVIQTKSLPKAGETVTGGQYYSLAGGKGANTAVAAQRLGANVSLIACVGEDANADLALQVMKNENVDLSHVNRLEGRHTGVAFINVSEDGENQIAVASGANMALGKQHLPNINADAIITQLEIPQTTILEAISNTDCFVCLNASPVLPGLPHLLKKTNLLIVNEEEHAAYKSELEGFSGLIAMTLGGSGARLYKDGLEVARAIPPRVSVIDTTGAGDSFAAALTVALLENQPYENALAFACTVGTLTTTKMGTQSASPYREEVDAFMSRSEIEFAK